ncbi:cytochrome P450 [Lolliginicoccus levis]|uniref:cytochrome P450 n=1 Tax=Lolliginicoccus levis TaxID=2919542 RepID=UPI00241BF87B|nr:cytochrome P450 [Lolliginicoccus levis]
MSAGRASLSLYPLLDPAVLSDPYPLYARIREHAPVIWDPYLHVWVVARYQESAEALARFSAERAATPSALLALGMGKLVPMAEVMLRQMLFLDAPGHGRIRGLAASALSPRRVASMRARIEAIAGSLVDAVADDGEMDVVADLAEPLPAMVTAELLGLPASDHVLLKRWSRDFADVLGTFQHNPAHAASIMRSIDEMTSYFRDALRHHADEGMIAALLRARADGDRLTEEEIIANLILVMVGGQETTTPLIGNGTLTLLRAPEAAAALRADPGLMPSAIEELLRFESPSQHTDRVAATDTTIAGEPISAGDTVVIVLAAANRDPRRFVDPDRLDLRRADNKHLAFGWSSHTCFGAGLARLEARIALETLLRRIPAPMADEDSVRWRANHAFRSLSALRVRWGS